MKENLVDDIEGSGSRQVDPPDIRRDLHTSMVVSLLRIMMVKTELRWFDAESFFLSCQRHLSGDDKFESISEFKYLMRDLVDAGLVMEMRGKCILDTPRNLAFALSPWFASVVTLAADRVAKTLATNGEAD
jgi:hypothetical protein